MKQDAIAKSKYSDFVKTIVKKQKVYSLENAEGIASADALYFTSKEGQARGMIFFWSEKRLAQAQCKNEWADYQPSELSLSEFLENYCIGLFTDKLIVGTNFDSKLIGYEIEPLNLVLDCIGKLRKAGTELKLNHYDNMQIFEKLVRENMSN